MTTEVFIADYQNPQHATDISFLLNSYAQDPMGGGQALPQYVQDNLAAELDKVPNAFTVLCYVDGKPAGLTNCLQGFSTFKCKPLINIHDVIVAGGFRGKQVSQHMLQTVEEVARQRGCCKITLEVLEGNTVAKNAYLKFGFAGYALDPNMGNAMFWEKGL
jgi:GNAT superfamily N-acetyltransferase|tara:strand:- start:12468 stop:12950 length:483 start_codon:yes stop_codon:yes gene_type:complete